MVKTTLLVVSYFLHLARFLELVVVFPVKAGLPLNEVKLEHAFQVSRSYTSKNVVYRW